MNSDYFDDNDLTKRIKELRNKELRNKELRDGSDNVTIRRGSAHQHVNGSLKNIDIYSRIVGDVVGFMFVGVIIGLFFDMLFHSKPIFLIISSIIACVALFKSIWFKYIK